MKIKMIDPDQLKPYFRNPRYNDKTVQALIKIIPKIGFNVPIVVDKDMVIIKGHARWNASRVLEMKKVPVIISEATEEQNNKDRILDNAVHELTEWNLEKLKVEIDKVGINLDEYKLKWVSKISSVTEGETEEDRLIHFLCPNCSKELTYSRKELLKWKSKK